MNAKAGAQITFSCNGGDCTQNFGPKVTGAATCNGGECTRKTAKGAKVEATCLGMGCTAR